MPIDDEGNYQDWIQAPESKHALKFLNTLTREGYLDANQFTIDNAGVKSYIASGRVLCFIGNTANTAANETQSGPLPVQFFPAREPIQYCQRAQMEERAGFRHLSPRIQNIQRNLQSGFLG